MAILLSLTHTPKSPFVSYCFGHLIFPRWSLYFTPFSKLALSKDGGEKAGTREVRAAGPLACGVGGGLHTVGEAEPQRMRLDHRGCW